MINHTTNFIFELAVKYDISFDDLKPKEFSNENLQLFCDDYIKKSLQRDIILKIYLKDNPKIFRTFLPASPYLFDTVFQVQWYYDELVVFDPISYLINDSKDENLEDRKGKLRNMLHYLNRLKNSINSGFLLFGSYEVFKTENNQFDNVELENLLLKPEVINECDKLVKVHKMESEEGLAKGYFQIRSEYRGQFSIFNNFVNIENLKSENGYSLSIDFANSKYIPLSVEDSKQGGFYEEAYKRFHKDYQIEFKEIYNYLNIGNEISTPVLFNRKLDQLILKNLTESNSISKSYANDFYKLFLPFVNGIPPEKLFDLREKMPDAFVDFRNYLFELIYDLEQNNIDPEIINIKIEQKVKPILRKLDAEIKNSINTVKIMGIGVPIVAGVATLGLSYFDIPQATQYLLGGINALNQAITFNNYRSENEVYKTNNLYYLWKIQNLKGK